MMQLRWIRCACVVLVAAAWAGVPVARGSSQVEELTKRLPDGVIGFVATSGGDALKGDFAKTSLGRIWNDPGVRSFYQSVKGELLAKIKQGANDPNAMRTADMVTRYAQLLLDRPLLVGIAQTQVKEGPPFCVFAIVDAGDRKAELAAAVSKLEAMAGEDQINAVDVGSFKMRGAKAKDGFPFYWGWVENRLVVVGNDAQGAILKYVATPRTAAALNLSKVPGSDDTLVAYFDYQKLGSLLGSMASMGKGGINANEHMAIYKGLGFGEAKLTARMGFAGPDLISHALIELPTPPTGVFAAYKPIDLAWFRAVDARAVTASAVNLDIAGLYDTVMNIVKTASPDEGYLQMRKAIIDFETEAKVRIREGLLASLAGPALFYSLPAGPIVESPRGGLVVVAKLKDAALFEKSMSALGEFAGVQAKGSLQISSRTRDDGRTVHIWGITSLVLLGLMPAWSIANDHVVIGSSVELCDLGVKQLLAKGAESKSLLDAEGYKKIAAGLPKELVTLTYTDSQAQLNQTLMQIQQFWPLLTMVAMQAGVKLPVALPSLTEIANTLGPACSYRYFGSDGLHSVYRGPGIEVSEMTVAGVAVGAGVALPAMAKAREQARRAASMSNLKQIGLGLHMYANDHQGNLPADLEQAKSHWRNAQVLESPRKPKDFVGPSYIYIPGQSLSLYPGNIVAYENPEFSADGLNVLFLDGHVEFMKPEAFRRELKETHERLGKPMPEVKFKGEGEAKPRSPRPPRPARAPQA